MICTNRRRSNSETLLSCEWPGEIFCSLDMKNLITVLILILLTGCTTIEISEPDVFDRHSTISADQFPLHDYQLHEMEIETDDGETIHSWFLERDDADATVIYFGGNGFLMVKSRSLIDAYSGIPVNLVMFDYRGYGRSTGTPDVAGIKTDSRAVYEAVRNDFPADTGPLYLHGHSMGTFLAAYMADTHEAAGYILESPITNVDQMTRQLVPWLLRPFIRFRIDQPVKDENNLTRVSNIEVPLLLMGGERDEITPFSMAEELYRESASAEKELVKIERGTHNDLPNSEIYRRALTDFLRAGRD